MKIRDLELKVVIAYLIEEKSHRWIESHLLGEKKGVLGFKARDVLLKFGLDGDFKGFMSSVRAADELDILLNKSTNLISRSKLSVQDFKDIWHQSKKSTAKIADPIHGEKLYQERAREALPILVRQAIAAEPIYYSALAEELNMPNPRNLNYVLGSIGQTLESLSKTFDEKIPPIQCLVLNKNTGLPGEGIGWFLIKGSDFSKLDKKQQKIIVDTELAKIYLYPKWTSVLKELGLNQITTDFSKELTAIKKYGGGESESHRKLKQYVCSNPSAVGLKAKYLLAKTEFPLLSGDSLDVMFRDSKEWVGVEVKSLVSDDNDLVRGLFQCVKYMAIMTAMAKVQREDVNIKVLLVLEGKLSPKLIELRNLLGVDVLEKVKP